MESTDKLNEFVDLNREQFDCFEPAPQLWDKIEAKQTAQQRKHTLLKTSMQVAAAVIIFVGIYVTVQFGVRSSSKETASQNNRNATTQAAEFKEAQQYYSSELQVKLEALKHHAKDYPDILNDTYTELQSLDAEYKNLQNDLQDGVQNEEVVSAMIQNYKYKLEIVDKINEVINEQEAHKTTLHHAI